MASLKKKKKPLTEKDLLKIEVAKELGIWDLIQSQGWGALTNETCGRVGGLVAKRLKDKQKQG